MRQKKERCDRKSEPLKTPKIEEKRKKKIKLMIQTTRQSRNKTQTWTSKRIDITIKV